MVDEMSTDEAFGWLAIAALNHMPHPEEWKPDPDDPMGNACCAVNCGPCSALKWMSGHDRRAIEYRIKLTGYAEGGWCFWDPYKNTLRWDWLETYWAAHKSCGMSNGVLTGCDFSTDDGLHGRDEDEQAELAAMHRTEVP